MTGKELIGKLEGKATVGYSFRFPYVYLRIVSDEFIGKDSDEREMITSAAINVSIADIRKTSSACLFSLEWYTLEEAKKVPINDRGEHWLKAFTQSSSPRPLEEIKSPALKTVHFYGYKGGQGRSTTLAVLSRYIADKGGKILVIDADIEAPSLDIMFNSGTTTTEATLLGITQKNTEIKAIPVYSGRTGGEVRLIACRNRDPIYDIDFAAFTLQTSLMPGLLNESITKIMIWAELQKFDAVFIDHRSGMAVTTLTVLRSAPGPVAVFSRLDEQWIGAKDVFTEIFRINPENPGIIISFKPDEENADSYRERTVKQRDGLLEILLDATTPVTVDDSEMELFSDPASIEDHWIMWPYDQAFRITTLPDLSKIGAMTLLALQELARLCDIKITEIKQEKKVHQLSASGSLDEGDLIQTEALISLRKTDNEIRYVLGRKGTGKTRLANQLAKEKIGYPLLVDNPYKISNQEKGISTASTEFIQARDYFKGLNDFEGLWWAVLLAGIESEENTPIQIGKNLSRIYQSKKTITSIRDTIISKIPLTEKMVFLFDGIETAFDSSDMYRFIATLFQFMLSLQVDSRLRASVKIVLFLRTDLVNKSGIQNYEQQIEGKNLSLYWDYQGILNFSLSRLKEYSFFKDNFSEAITEIEEKKNDIHSRSLSVEECEQLFLKVFPSKLRRSNLLTTTFMRLHFADSSPQGASYYPRIMDAFLKDLDKRGKQSKSDALVEDRINQQLIFKAHETASIQYMEQLKQELQHLFDFKQSTLHENRQKLDNWIDAFALQKTPFSVSEMEKYLLDTVKLSSEVIRKSLEQMREFGIFERTENLDIWRAGRLFKASLKMKFHRG